MKYLTPQQILAKLKEFDKNTIFSVYTIISFTKANNIKYTRGSGRYLINFEEFLQTINPKNINQNYQIPIIRKQCKIIERFNKKHKTQIDYHVIEGCVKMCKNGIFNDQTLYLINYKLFEDTIISYLISKGLYMD